MMKPETNPIGRMPVLGEWRRVDVRLRRPRGRVLTGAVYAKLHSEIPAPNKIVVNTNHIRRYTVLLNQDLVDFSKPIIIETNGKMSFEGMVDPRIDTLLQEVRHRPETHILFPAKLTIDGPSTNTVNEK